MGYTERAAGFASFNKAVISLWFGVPAEVLEAVGEIDDNPVGGVHDGWGGYFVPPLHKIIPFLVFGSQEVSSDSDPISPSYVGISILGTEQITVAVALQTAVEGDFSLPPTDPTQPARPACFEMMGYAGVGNEADSLNVTPDVWHHVLISFDISSSCEIVWFDTSGPTPDPLFVVTPGPTFGWAFDDVPKINFSMYPSGGETWDVSANNIIPQTLIQNALDTNGQDVTVEVAGCEIAQSGNPIGIPSTGAYVDNVYNVHVAEVQIFTDVTVDVTDEAVRRKFVTASGHPASPALAAALLGKQPEVYFQTHNDWITGNNRGTAGDFIPVGTITAFTPGP